MGKIFTTNRRMTTGGAGSPTLTKRGKYCTFFHDLVEPLWLLSPGPTVNVPPQIIGNIFGESTEGLLPQTGKEFGPIKAPFTSAVMVFVALAHSMVTYTLESE